MEIKKEENVSAEYEVNETENIDSSKSKSTKKKISLKKWGIVGATLIVAGMVITKTYYYNQISGGLIADINPLIVNAYNDRFKTYFGKNRSLSEVQAIVNLVNAHNGNSMEVDDFGGKIEIIADDIVTKNGNTYVVNGTNAKKSWFYTIESSSFNNGLGYISNIVITYSPNRIPD